MKITITHDPERYKKIVGMKIIFPVFLFSLISVMAGCQSVYDIRFTTSTRGYSKEIVITPKTITLHEQNFREPSKEKNTSWEIRKEDWKKLLQSFEDVMPSEFPLLKAPSDKRAFDGARTSTLIVTDKKGKTWHHAFDDEDPNQKLQPLMNVINELISGK